ncbi:hypothetical protein OUZ56_026864 [Daphnia magna]|uniref:Uncharacterized protein n=1 Tax=Daphnia magna TaxID=35525 RepID=A0ABQ9ZN24_9CRUS|nr:hypothetical protein OUZ56_026864 [Daphnia magna]
MPFFLYLRKGDTNLQRSPVKFLTGHDKQYIFKTNRRSSLIEECCWCPVVESIGVTDGMAENQDVDLLIFLPHRSDVEDVFILPCKRFCNSANILLQHLEVKAEMKLNDTHTKQ